MKILLHLGTAILFLLSACESNQQTANVEPEKNTANDELTNRDEASQKTDGFLAALQGRWKRTTYPNGTVEFKGNEVKFVVGEGTLEPPQFQRFRLSDSCPYSADQEQEATYLDLMVLEEAQTCESVKLKDDSLSIGFTPTTAGIVYTRMQNGESSKAANKSQDYAIPKSIRGEWVTGEGRCGGRSHYRITIDANSIHFFERTTELSQIAEYEPTRVAGKFNYESPDGKVLSPQITLDTKENGKVLIFREYGEDAHGPIRYDRCE